MQECTSVLDVQIASPKLKSPWSCLNLSTQTASLNVTNVLITCSFPYKRKRKETLLNFTLQFLMKGWYHSPLIKHKQIYWKDVEATRQLPRMHIHCWVNKSQTIKAYKINMFCYFLSTCAWLYIKSHQGKRAGCLRSRLHLPEGRGNPYLAASSDFIPRNPAPRAPIQ